MQINELYHKPFSKASNAECDKPARATLISFLEQVGFTNIKEYDEAKNNFKNLYDVTGYYNGKLGCFEVGVKKDWGTRWKEDDDINGWENKRVPFPHSNLHELFRKGNFANNKRLNVTHNVIVGGDYKRLVIINRRVVLGSEIIQKECKNIPDDKLDTFFSIPVTNKELIWVELHDGKWKKIMLKEAKEINFDYLNN